MQAIVDGRVIADSPDVIECKGYHYFPREIVLPGCLRSAPRTASDLECPHGVQFYDVVLDGRVHERAAWSYEAPQPAMAHVGHRMGFWKDVLVR